MGKKYVYETESGRRYGWYAEQRKAEKALKEISDLGAALRGTPPAPCAKCKQAQKCAAKLVACKTFATYVGITSDWIRAIKRNKRPTRKVFLEVFTMRCHAKGCKESAIQGTPNWGLIATAHGPDDACPQHAGHSLYAFSDTAIRPLRGAVSDRETA